MEKFKAIIFDLDGTLIDSELHWVDAEKKFLSTYGLDYTQEWVSRVMGKSLTESSKLLKEIHNLPHSHEEILAEKIKHSDPIYTHHAQPMPGAEKLLSILKDAGFQLAIASGSSLSRIQTIVSRFGWEKYFDQLCSTDHVGYIGKPDPAIFNYTAQSLEMAPSDCLVFEDSVNGLRAAKGAAMSCVAVINPDWSFGDFSQAELSVQTLEDKAIYNFLDLPYEQ